MLKAVTVSNTRHMLATISGFGRASALRSAGLSSLSLLYNSCGLYAAGFAYFAST